MDKLKMLRKEIDEIDENIVDLLIKRFDKSIEIWDCKKGHEDSNFDQLREKQIIEKLEKRINNEMYFKSIAMVYFEILKNSKIIQLEKK